jgi:hypothetical protein
MSKFLISKSYTVGEETNKSKHHKKEKKHNKSKDIKSSVSGFCNISCCPSEMELDCCSLPYLRLDKLRQGWSDIATTGGESIPDELRAVNYVYNTSGTPQFVITGSTVNGTNGTVNVTFNAKDKAGNYINFPGVGTISFYYDTNPLVTDDVSVIYNFSTNPVNPLNLASLNAILRLTGEYFDGTTWVGMSLAQFLNNSSEYAGEYAPPTLLPTSASEYTETFSGSYTTTVDNALWSYLFVQTHRYPDVEACGKKDQVLGWYINTTTGQLVLYNNESELGLNISDDRLGFITTPIESLSKNDKQKLYTLNILYNLTVSAIEKLNNNFKVEGNILKVTDSCGRNWLIAINRATSGLSDANNTNTEYTVVATILC